MLASKFQPNDVPFFPVIGNEDVVPSYNITTGSPVLARYAEMWSASLACAACTAVTQPASIDENGITFRRGGYYIVSPIPGLRLVVINSVLYADLRFTRGFAKIEDDPAGQFAWMANQFEAARANNEYVMICGHVPPAITNNEHLAFGEVNSRLFETAQWLEKYVARYVDMVANYSDVVTAQFFGHTHRDTFRVSSIDAETQDDTAKYTAPLMIVPSVSPIFFNNAAFRVFTFDTLEMLLVDAKTYFGSIHKLNAEYSSNNLPALPSTSFKLEYGFKQSYGASTAPYLNGETLFNILQSIAGSDTYYSEFITFFRANFNANRLAFLCEMGTFSNSTYQACYNTFRSNPL